MGKGKGRREKEEVGRKKEKGKKWKGINALTNNQQPTTNN
jgi:hypothetical protein